MFEGLQFIPDRAKALAEFRRLLKPKACLAGTLWGPLQENAPYHALAEGLGKFVSPEAGKLPPFALWDPAVIRTLLAQARFSQILVEPQTIVRRLPSSRVRAVGGGRSSNDTTSSSRSLPMKTGKNSFAL